MTEVNSTVSENASFTSVSPEKTGRRKKKCNLLQQISNILTSFSGRNVTALSFMRKKNEITPAIHSLSRVWNINSLSPAKHSPLLVFYHWSCTSNEALRVTQSPEPTTATIFSCATARVENYQKLWWKGCCTKSLWGLAKFLQSGLTSPSLTVLL